MFPMESAAKLSRPVISAAVDCFETTFSAKTRSGSGHTRVPGAALLGAVIENRVGVQIPLR